MSSGAAGSRSGDKEFAGSIPALYESVLVPLIFEVYAEDMARRVAAVRPSSVLELAAGTGVVTRHLARALPPSTTITATDLNQAMIDEAAARGTDRPVEWKQADALALPFPDESFDVVVCQYGAMFFPDKPKGYSEARRVLRPGGTFLFNVWDDIADNEFADVVTTAVGKLFPDDPPLFLARTPHGYHDRDEITKDLAAAGFEDAPTIETVAERSRAASPDIPAIAYCHGTILRTEIEARGSLDEATDVATQAVAERFGATNLDSKIQALVVSQRK
jgi:ubiquinone/menaquinone biosynthesis C-methylase UbiE